MPLHWPGPAEHGLESQAPPLGSIISYLCFTLARTSLVTDAARVREIMPGQPLMDFPQPYPDYVRGGLYLRGRVVPVVDLAARLGLPAARAASKGYLIVREVGSRPHEILVGFLVQRVTGMVDIRKPDFRGDGQVRVKGRARRVVNLDRLFRPEELDELGRLAR
jgi:purine-binding chemotaxis protein CheW